MTMTTREQRRQLERENAKRPAVLTEVPRTQWPDAGQPSDRVRAWVSRDYLVQEFAVADSLVTAAAMQLKGRRRGFMSQLPL